MLHARVGMVFGWRKFSRTVKTCTRERGTWHPANDATRPVRLTTRYPPMGNASWVCFDCRESVRRPCGYQADVPCPKCAQNCRCIGTKIPVPRKRDAKAWRELRESLDAQAIQFAESQHRRQIRQRAV
jgi:hypothetical protein